MTTAMQKRTPMGSDGVAALSPRLTREESFHKQPVAIRNNVLYNKPRAALVIIPQLMDNPLFEGSSEEGSINPSSENSCSTNFQGVEQHRRRLPLSRLSLDESAGTKAVRRMQSLSLSARDYEGMWRTAQENVCKSSRNTQAMSALEDFKQFRQKLADLKQTKEEAASPRKANLTSSGSNRSGSLGSASTRSLNLSPSRPTSPLKRLSVLASRKGVSSLNPQRDSQRLGAALPPSVQKFAISMRAEGLFKLPNPASISPVSCDPYSPPQTRPPLPRPADSVTSPAPALPPVKAPKRRFFIRGRLAESNEGPRDAAKAAPRGPADSQSLGDILKLSKTGRRSSKQTRASPPVSNDESFMTSCTPRFSALQSPRALRNATQQQPQVSKKQQTERTLVPSCSPRAKDLKARCIHIPRPVCYGVQFLE